MRQILAKRREVAKVLGYADYADLQTEERMIGSGSNAARFAVELTDRTREHFEREVADLEAFAASELGLAPLEPWDVQYALEKLRMARFAMDEEELRPYFPLPGVLRGLFDLTERLFGVTVKRVRVPPGTRRWRSTTSRTRTAPSSARSTPTGSRASRSGPGRG